MILPGLQDQTFQKPYSEATAKVIDEEVHTLVEGAYSRAKDILEKTGINYTAGLRFTR